MKHLCIYTTVVIFVSFFTGMWFGSVLQAKTTDELAIRANNYINRLENDITRVTKEQDQCSEYILDVVSECDEYQDWYDMFDKGDK